MKPRTAKQVLIRLRMAEKALASADGLLGPTDRHDKGCAFLHTAQFHLEAAIGSFEAEPARVVGSPFEKVEAIA